MNIYAIILVELLLLSSSILLLFKFRSKLGLAPLYILLGSVQYLQANLGSSVSFNVFGDLYIYPGSIILFSGVLFAVLLIYIKEGVASARALIFGIIISNVIMTLMFEITYIQQIINSEINNIPIHLDSVFNINFKYFLSGTALLFLDFFLLVILYQYIISRFKKLPIFLTIFTALLIILIFDAIAFNVTLFYGTPLFKTSLISHILGKSISALVFSTILFLYLKYLEKEPAKTAFIANQNRDIFSILTYRKKYKDLKVEKEKIEKKLTSQLESTLDNISDGFVSLDTNWCYTYINSIAAGFLGKSPESLIGKHIWTEFPEGVGLPFYNAYYKAVETRQTQYFEDYYEPFDRWFENRIYPSPEGLTIYFTDITKKKKADTNNKMLLSLIETNNDFIGLSSLEGKPIYLNTNGRKLVGFDMEEPLPNSISEFFPEHYQDKIVKEHMPAILKNERWNGVAEFKNFKTGGIIPIEMSGFLIKDSTTNKPLALGIVATDITKRKEAEGKLIKSEELFRGLTSNAPVAIFHMDKDGVCNFVNEAWIKYSGLTFNESIGYGWSNAIHPEDKDRVVNEWQESILTKNELISDYRLVHKNGEVKWLSSKTVGLFDANNELYGSIGTLIDITKIKKYEAQLIKSEKYLDNIINNIADPVFVKDEQSRFLLANDAFCQIFNLSREDIIGKVLADSVAPEEIEMFLRIDREVLATGIKNVNEETITISETETLAISSKKTRFVDSSGNKFLVGVVRDITERKKAEEQIIKSEQYLNNIINNIGDPVFVKDNNSRMVLVNDALCKIFNISRKDIIGKTLSDNVPKEERDKFLSTDKEVFLTGVESVNEETLSISKDEFFTISSKKTRFIDSSGEKFIIGVIRDVTERKKTEIELEKYRNNLEELVELRTSEFEKEKIKAQSADLMKSAFLATMSHELRTPMNSIIGFTSILLKEFSGPLNEEQKKQLSMVKTSGQNLLGLINDVLDISKIEAGELRVSLSNFNYLTTLEKTIDFLLPQATKKGLIIDSEIAKMHITLNSDERRVEQVLLNLLSNAIKFSNKGVIQVKVDVVDYFVVTQVIDQGIGINKENINKLFMPFIQLESGLSKNHVGTGLGLAISKNLIEKLGGTIQVQSKVGKGSNFTFKLPLEHVDDN